MPEVSIDDIVQTSAALAMGRSKMVTLGDGLLMLWSHGKTPGHFVAAGRCRALLINCSVQDAVQDANDWLADLDDCSSTHFDVVLGDRRVRMAG